ncbi:MAG: phosphoribosylanthranilate isomerase [Proteobacteria bacterium]|nr:phosphoribosylanthranilate isomerase [Pseudomonadota bacterium]
MRETISPTRIKFCGMTRIEDVQRAVELGVDAIGFVFVPRSRRCVDVDRARRLRAIVPAATSVVALVMNQTHEDIATIVERVRPDVLQFHGNEDDAFCAAFGVPFLKALAMGGVHANAVPERLARYPSAAGFVFDGHAPGAMGGSGERCDWNALAGSHIERPWLLAGGLNAGNVSEAIRIAHPWGVDVASGIESAPGIKDHAAMRAFVTAVRAADSPLSPTPLPQGERGYRSRR